MATAKATITKTPVITTTYTKSRGITLELTEREAETLRHVMCLVGGPPSTRRKDTDSISAALRDAGVPWIQRNYPGCRPSPEPTIASTGSIYFPG